MSLLLLFSSPVSGILIVTDSAVGTWVVPSVAVTLGLDPITAPSAVSTWVIPSVTLSQGTVPTTPSTFGVMDFAALYGTDLDTELGSDDRIQRFTTVLRKRYANEGQRVFNEQTSCFVKRAPIALTSGVAEYDLESASVISAADYLWPSKTSASLRRYDGAGAEPSDFNYVEGDSFPFKSEEELNHTRPNWRSEAPGVPQCWTMREDGGYQYLVLIPAPLVPAVETWVLMWPYVAVPEDMVNDTDEPFSVSGNVRTTLRPYHRAILHYTAAQCEKLRKNYEGSERHLKLFAAGIAKYHADQQPKRGSQIRLSQDYRRRLRSGRPPDPYR